MLRSIMVLSVLAIFLAVGCGAGKYGDAKKVLGSQIDAMESFASAMEKASSGKDVAEAIIAYSAEMKILMPEMKKLSEKYPELTGKEPPAELKELTERSEGVAKRFVGALMKASMKYARDPEVAKALKGMGNVMKVLQK